MRSEQFERLRRRAGITLPSRPQAARRITTPPSRGGQCSRWPSRTRRWWSENLHRPANLYLTRIKSEATAAEDGIAQPALERSVTQTVQGERGLGSLTRLTQASTEVPGFHWINQIPYRKKILRRVQHHWKEEVGQAEVAEGQGRWQ